MFVLFFNRSPYVQVYSSCLVPRRVLADSRATVILVPRWVSWERRREKRAMQITISLMAESNLCKTRGKEKKKSFRVFFSEGKVHQLVLKNKIPCLHSSCEMDPQFFERNGISRHFRWYTNVRS